MQSSDYRFATPADLAACRALLRNGSRTFFVASLLLPAHLRCAATSVYGFCRLADDAVDLDGGLDVLGKLRERLDRIYAGRPAAIAADRAFADVVERFGIPRAVPEALLEGFEWDASGRRYETLADLNGYAARVAGTVGVMLSLLMGQRAPEIVARACELGMAMQLTNIARDIGEDARMGRIYLPLSWLRAANIDPEAWLARPVYHPAIGDAVQRILDAADALYVQAETGIAHLPARCRPGIRAARLLYAQIGREVERRQCNSVDARAVVSGRDKLRLLCSALAAPPMPSSDRWPQCSDEGRFLIDAVCASSAPTPQITPSWWDLSARARWLFDLFERLERRERMNVPLN